MKQFYFSLYSVFVALSLGISSLSDLKNSNWGFIWILHTQIPYEFFCNGRFECPSNLNNNNNNKITLFLVVSKLEQSL